MPKIQDAPLRTEPGACSQFKLSHSGTISSCLLTSALPVHHGTRSADLGSPIWHHLVPKWVRGKRLRSVWTRGNVVPTAWKWFNLRIITLFSSHRHTVQILQTLFSFFLTLSFFIRSFLVISPFFSEESGVLPSFLPPRCLLLPSPSHYCILSSSSDVWQPLYSSSSAFSGA